MKNRRPYQVDSEWVFCYFTCYSSFIWILLEILSWFHVCIVSSSVNALFQKSLVKNIIFSSYSVGEKVFYLIEYFQLLSH